MNFIPKQSSPDENSSLGIFPSTYRGWIISTKMIDGQLWLRWQHPHEDFPRYGCPLGPMGMVDTVRHVRFLIDLAIKLENQHPK